MKATIKYLNYYSQRRQVTIEVERNEPNAILQEAYRLKKINRFDYVKTIKCGRYEYQWMGRASEALPWSALHD